MNTGSLRSLAESYESAKRWVDYVHRNNPNLIWMNARGMDWGDWLSAGPETPKELGSTAFFAHSADLVAKMARALGRDEEADTYGKLFAKIKASFVARYVSPDGIIQMPQSDGGDDVQGSYALALHFRLLDEPLRSAAVQRLVKVIARDGGHVTTGFWSSVELVLALSEAGRHDVASQLTNLTTYPSWGAMLQGNGTTFWEAFDADKRALSFNHWTHSACGEWLWREVAGLNPDAERPGYRRFTVRPRPTSSVTWCKASYGSVRGLIKIDWSQKADRFTLELQVPVGSVARVFVPGEVSSIRESGRAIEQAKGVRFLHLAEGIPVYEVESGSYHFTAVTRAD